MPEIDLTAPADRYFQSAEYWAAVGGGIDDGNRRNMNGSKLAELLVPFPESEAEQRRFVALD